MNFNVVDGVLGINVDMVTTAAIASFLFILGFFIKSKSKFLTKYCIPAPVVGGFLFMFFTWFGNITSTFAVNFTVTLQPFFMNAFFATVGLGASLSLLKKGGMLLGIYWVIAVVLSIFQNILAIGVAPVVNLDYAYAVMVGALSMIGGHGAAAAYGASIEAMGWPGASVVGAAAATYGLVVSVIFGAPIARRLVEKYNLRPDPTENLDTSVMDVNSETSAQKLSGLDIMKNVSVILLCMSFGAMFARWISSIIGMGFPDMVGAMLLAVIVRNLNEKVRVYKFDYPLVSNIGDVTLGLFLSMALMNLRLWELAGLAGPMMIILVLQTALVLAVVPIVFRILGKTYDAAVMCAGFVGHGLGATPTAVVNMTALNDRYGMSRKAMMIVPIVGAFLVDIIYHPQTIWFIGRFVENLNP